MDVDNEIKALQREIKQKGCYLTALRWRRGKILIEIQEDVGYGNFYNALRDHMIPKQRASEDMRIAEYFPSEEAAGQVSVPKHYALSANRK